MNWKKISLRILKFAFKFVFYFILFIVFYLTSAYFISRIEYPCEKSKEAKNITIFIKSNGVHTDIVVPTKTSIINWRNFVLPENTRKKDSTCQYLAFGWGDKGFYLETPTWGELKTSTALNAAFGLSTTAIHTTYYSEVIPDKTTCKKIRITRKQYKRLSFFILKSFAWKKNNQLKYIKTNYVYGDNDAFYDAVGTYSMLQTCNSWANNALLSCGQKAALWTAFQGGIFYHYE